MYTKEKRKVYDKLRARQQYAIYKENRQKVLDLFNNECKLCKKHKSSGQLHLHHLEYHPTESNYPRTSNGWSRMKRIQEAAEHPERFVLVCNLCHVLFHHIERAIKQGVDLDTLYSLLSQVFKSNEPTV